MSEKHLKVRGWSNREDLVMVRNKRAGDIGGLKSERTGLLPGYVVDMFSDWLDRVDSEDTEKTGPTSDSDGVDASDSNDGRKAYHALLQEARTSDDTDRLAELMDDPRKSISDAAAERLSALLQ